MSKVKHTLTTQHIVYFIVIKTVSAFQSKILFPFLPIFAQKLNYSISELSWVIVCQQIAYIFNPFLSAKFEDWNLSPKTIQYISWTLILFASALSTIPHVSALAITRFIGVMGQAMQLSNISAILSRHLPPERKNCVVSLSEYGWAFGTFLLVPAGYMIEIISWQSPFIATAIFSVLVLATMPWVFPADEFMENSTAVQLDVVVGDDPANPEEEVESTQRNSNRNVTGQERLLTLTFRSSKNMFYWIFSFVSLIVVGSFFTMQGLWLVEKHGFGAGWVGIVSVLSGTFEICGSTIVALASTNYLFQTQNMIIQSLAVCSTILLILEMVVPSVYSLPVSISVSSVCFLVSESLIVSSLTSSVSDEISTDDLRNTSTAISAALIGAGTAIGSSLTVALWGEHGSLRNVMILWVIGAFCAAFFYQLFYCRTQNLELETDGDGDVLVHENKDA